VIAFSGQKKVVTAAAPTLVRPAAILMENYSRCRCDLYGYAGESRPGLPQREAPDLEVSAFNVVSSLVCRCNVILKLAALNARWTAKRSQ
jgi:hypothetical protein